MVETLVSSLQSRIGQAVTRRASGRVLSVTGPLVRAHMPGASIGELCELREPGGMSRDRRIAEVVGLEGSSALLSVLGDTRGLSIRTEVYPSGAEATIRVGDFLLGCVIDATGALLRGSPNPPSNDEGVDRFLKGSGTSLLDRRRIEAPFSTGIPAVDGLLTVGEGQRMGIFGSPGTGKSSLIATLMRNARADVVVTALVGERGREVGEFVDRTMPLGAPSNSILVVATSDRPALERFRAAVVATTIAEHFRDQGKRVLLIRSRGLPARFARSASRPASRRCAEGSRPPSSASCPRCSSGPATADTEP